MSTPNSSPQPLSTRKLTWAALLARWVEFARSAVALPDNPPGRRMRQSIADIIVLQAVCFALGELDQLPVDQRALGMDRAEVLIDKHSEAIMTRWGDEPLPTALNELIDDARAALGSASLGT